LNITSITANILLKWLANFICMTCDAEYLHYHKFEYETNTIDISILGLEKFINNMTLYIEHRNNMFNKFNIFINDFKVQLSNNSV